MKVLVGLGNLGERFRLNRHNIGFMVVNRIANSYGQTSWVNKFNGQICKCVVDDQRFLLLKPGTFMNNSGVPVLEATQFYKLSPDHIIVFQDDLDLEFGQIKIKKDAGHAGHNGIRSIHSFIGKNYLRVRIGIGHPGEKSRVSSYVLSDFTIPETRIIEEILQYCNDNVSYLVNENEKNFLDAFNQGNSK